MTDTAKGFAAWHPKDGFACRYDTFGPIAYAEIDDAIEVVTDRNRDAGTNNRTGWRIVPVTVTRVDAP